MLTRQQAVAGGLTLPALRHRVTAGGRWQRLLPGVYATFDGPLQQQHRLRTAVRYAGDPCWLTGASLCRLRGMTYVPEGDDVDVLLPIGRRVRRQDWVVPRRTSRPPNGPRWVSGLPGDSIASAALIVARRSRSLREVRAVLCEAVQRRLAHPDALLVELEAGPSAGSALPRRALQDVIAGCRSASECELRDLFGASRVLPEPQWNLALPGVAGRPLVPDAWWREARLVVEVDSLAWHGFGTKPEETEQRRGRYAAHGWRVYRVSPWRLRAEPPVVLGEVEAAYLEGVRATAGDPRKFRDPKGSHRSRGSPGVGGRVVGWGVRGRAERG